MCLRLFSSVSDNSCWLSLTLDPLHPTRVPELRLLVTGGIGPDDVAPWLEAGALAVGLGSNLGTAATDGVGEVERRCRAALAAAS